MPDQQMKDKISEELKDVRKKSDDIMKKIAETDFGKRILGDDGKFDKRDIDRMTRKFRASKAGMAIFGEDGKLDEADIKRYIEKFKEYRRKIKASVNERVED